MEKYIYNEQNGLHYELAGDYYLPCLTTPELPELGIWGRCRLNHLQKHHQPLYTGMLLSGKLGTHLEEIDHTAAQRHTMLTHQLVTSAGITEELKASDQMAWVGAMNNIRNAAEEIILAELICP